MTRRQTERFLEQLVKAVPRGIASAGIKTNSCILSTRLGVEALRSSRIRARPLAVRLAVVNTAFQELRPVGPGDKPYTAEEVKASGAWMVTLGHPVDDSHPAAVIDERPGGWNGHLVVIADERYLVDLSAGQVQRLARPITAEPFWTPALQLSRNEAEAFQADDGCLWLYDPEPQRRDYLRAPAWSGYRVVVRGNRVVSERIGPRPEVVAPRVVVEL